MEKIFELLSPITHFIERIIVFLYSNVIENYGVVIILLTIIVRLILVPLSITQTRSMVKMQKIQPELKELQKKYKNDREKLQQETMEFYKKHNVNPLAGCLPLILQMPIFFALFQALRSPSEIVTNVLGNFEINGVANPNYNFLWMNLGQKDPYYILVILMVATMFLSMRMTTADPKQSKLTYIMPLAFGAISITIPYSGILVYWVTTNIWSIGQQWVVSRIITRRSVRQELVQKEEAANKEIELSDEEKRIIRRKIKKKKKKKR